jgi:hypothetical protein
MPPRLRVPASLPAFACRHVRVLAVVLAVLIPSAGGVPPGAAPEPDTLTPAANELLDLIRAGDWGPLEWGRASYLVAQLSCHGPRGVPRMRERFLPATSPEEAFLTGLYVSAYGSSSDHGILRRDLESSPRKQEWLRRMAGDKNAINASLSGGAAWAPAVQLLPTPDGCRKFCALCMESDNTLVRRAGMLWGYWISDPDYWGRVRSGALRDPDMLTRQLAGHLLRRKHERK